MASYLPNGPKWTATDGFCKDGRAKILVKRNFKNRVSPRRGQSRNTRITVSLPNADLGPFVLTCDEKRVSTMISRLVGGFAK